MKRRRALLLSIAIVLALCVACGWWLHQERQQYAHDRALIDALTHRDTNTALALVKQGADPNTRLDPTPAPTLPQLLRHLLHRLPSPVNNSPTAFLIACGAFWPTTTKGGTFVAASEEYLPLVQAMLAHGANIHVRESDRRTPLYEAISNDRLHTAELLLQQGADVNAQDAQGLSPLMLTAWHSRSQVARLLLSHGANPNAQDVAGNSPLYYALLAFQNKQLITELLAHGANPHLPNRGGLTPLQWAQKNNFPDLVRLMEQERRR